MPDFGLPDDTPAPNLYPPHDAARLMLQKHGDAALFEVVKHDREARESGDAAAAAYWARVAGEVVVARLKHVAAG
jgi:hypothetical protein